MTVSIGKIIMKGVHFVTRMRVPKMVKNGVYSSFEIWGQFCAAHLFSRRDLAKTSCFLPSLDTVKTGLSNKPVPDQNRQKKNKNHFRPISEQACALI
jgi:hypothetical protein